MTAIDLGLVEEGIEIGKKMMAEVIAAYPNAGKGAAAAALGAEALAKAAPTPIGHDAKQPRNIAEAQSKAQVVPAVGNGSGYLNEVSSSLNVPHNLVAVFSGRAGRDAGLVQVVDPPPSGLVLRPRERFFSYWVFSLGDLSKIEVALPPAEVNVYGTGHVKGAFASVADIATVTVRALNDPGMENREVRITANTMTQTELIDTWQKISGKRVKQVAVTAAEVEDLIASATAPDQQMMRIGTELHRSMWIRGDAVKRAGVALEATEVYPDIPIQTVEAGLARLL